jgi:hypothetical protein
MYAVSGRGVRRKCEIERRPVYDGRTYISTEPNLESELPQHSVIPHRREIVDFRALCCERVVITHDPHM